MRGGLPGRLPTIIVLLLALLVLAGCDGDAFGSNDFFMTWLTTVSADEGIEGLSGRTGDDDADAVLTAADAMKQIEYADLLHDKAKDFLRREQPDRAAEYLDEVIRLRPGDARYRRDRAAVAMQLGDTKAALMSWDAMDEIARENNWDLDPTYWMDAELDAGTEQERLEAQPPGPARDAALAAAYTRLGDIYERWETARGRGGALDSAGLSEMQRMSADYYEKAAALKP